MKLEERIIRCAKANGADLVGFAGIDRFAEDKDTICKIFPQTKTVIGLLFRVLRGLYRGLEEGSNYYQYPTMGVEHMEEIIMPLAQLKVCNVIEDTGFTAVPQRKHLNIMAEINSTNPEINDKVIKKGVARELQMDFIKAAVNCGLGELGMSGSLLTDDFGPFQRYCFILCDAPLAGTPVSIPHLCDKCGKCIKACPGHAISENGEKNPWQCAVYYKGANAKRNPFMPPDALKDAEDRKEILEGKAELSPERAREILNKINFYPGVGQNYQSSVCGRACDRACYVHLEEKGLLKRKFNTCFRKREEWELP